MGKTHQISLLLSANEKLEGALLWRDFGREMGERERVEAALVRLLIIESSE